MAIVRVPKFDKLSQSSGSGSGTGAGTPVAITASGALTEAAHANRPLQVNSATAVTLALPATSTDGDRYYGVNLGAGALTITLDGGGAVPANALLPLTVDQYSAWEVQRHATGFVRIA